MWTNLQFPEHLLTFTQKALHKNFILRDVMLFTIFLFYQMVFHSVPEQTIFDIKSISFQAGGVERYARYLAFTSINKLGN